jgi:ribosome-binding factor A
MKGLRGERLASQFQQEISVVISTKLRNKHPELSAIISVTQADVAPDLKTAKVYISIYDPDEKKKLNSFKILKDNAGFVRHELAQVLRLRTVPELQFILDGSMEYGAKIDKLLENLDIKEEEDEQ